MADSQLSQWSQLITGTMAGVVATLVATRTRFAMMQRDIDKTQTQLERHMATANKRSLVMLRLLTDVARKVGVDNRKFDDALVRMLSDSDEANTGE